MTEALTATLRALLPPGVALGQADPTAPVTGLLPQEAAAMARAVPARQREFAAGRRAARAAMITLGLPSALVPQGGDRAPVWPDGLTGTISHGAGTCLALVARVGDFAGLGLDLEPATALPDDLRDTVCTTQDRARHTSALAGRLIFCAKEATYKAQYVLSRQLLEFHDLAVTLSPDVSRFTATLLRPCPPFAEGTTFSGHLAIADGIIAALITLPHESNTVFPDRGQ
ncbi:4'-phosphopantetheinyl transferase EntD (siderophore biosynthesis) [Roseovarius tolerans]|uniref:Enterobactin synthase component D n=1 Tax=Roseovarius tolerans TaxID=74031 RepID=A0A1H8C7B1_9RHOB|nr:4'-phosphopantetheinyl transferase superfamily protein [Roseovarius tolerans]SEM91091.1 4'-phosphopantetheinyl transferase EntD (siderophore biosynthesis) [Roseovarius tolerans]